MSMLRKIGATVVAIVCMGIILYFGTWAMVGVFMGAMRFEHGIANFEKNHPILNNLPLILTPVIILAIFIWNWRDNRRRKRRAH